MMTEARTSVTDVDAPMEEITPKMCMIDDPSDVEELAADAHVTCGMCGLKAHDAANVCEPGIHADSL